MMHNVHEAQRSYGRELKQRTSIQRGSWQSTATELATHELDNVLLTFRVPDSVSQWAAECEPDLPWAETHFAERVSGEPLNPAPSYRTWPWHSAKYIEQFKADSDAGAESPFDHTYPERFWPKVAATVGGETFRLRRGVRFNYGDLGDVIDLLRRDPFTRQAFLPVWFPEDTGSTQGQRVPCTIGYHFIRNGTNLDIKYIIRSCDITRHFKNDAYMAGRLLQYVTQRLRDQNTMGPFYGPGNWTMYISNLHLFTNDAWRF